MKRSILAALFGILVCSSVAIAADTKPQVAVKPPERTPVSLSDPAISLEKLKALAYDLTMKLTSEQQNLQMVQQEIIRRQQAELQAPTKK